MEKISVHVLKLHSAKPSVPKFGAPFFFGLQIIAHGPSLEIVAGPTL
jgi:hypothetical protein